VALENTMGLFCQISESFN